MFFYGSEKGMYCFETKDFLLQIRFDDFYKKSFFECIWTDKIKTLHAKERIIFDFTASGIIKIGSENTRLAQDLERCIEKHFYSNLRSK